MKVRQAISVHKKSRVSIEGKEIGKEKEVQRIRNKGLRDKK